MGKGELDRLYAYAQSYTSLKSNFILSYKSEGWVIFIKFLCKT